MNCNLGRRDRKKAATRTALSTAAMRLALEHGVDHVSAESIAEAADVAPRTFRNYFSNKEEAIVAALLDQARDFADLLRDRPAAESTWDALRAAVRTLYSVPAENIELMRAQIMLITTTPSLLPHTSAMFAQVDGVLALAVAERSGTDVDTDLYPRLQAAMAVAALKTALVMWTQGTSSAASLADAAVEALDLLRAGLPEPTRAPAH